MAKLKLTKKKMTETKPQTLVKKPKAKNTKFKVLVVLLSLGIFFVTCVLVFALYIIITAPEFNRDKLYKKESTIIYYADGTEMTRYGAEDRILVTYDDLPQVLVDAIVATEDSRFFQHTGLDVARFAKAFIGQLLGNDAAGGASTLSMQVIKNDYTSRESKGIEGIIRKFTDIYMSIFKLESNYTKEEIMEFYVNTMWFANDGNIYVEGLFGVEQASQYFFGKSVSDLSLAEASIIAGMFQNARTLNPYTNEEKVAERQNTVLKLMVQHGYITEQEKEDAQKIPISSLLKDHSKNENKTETNYKAVVDYVVKQVNSETGKNPFVVPMKIYTTIDKDVQNVLTRLENGELYTFKDELLQEGIAITSTENGSIVALSGGRDYKGLGTNMATGISRQPGSAAKPFMDYGPFLEAFPDASPSTLFLDRPTTYSNGQSIKNSDGSYLGLIPMRVALARSRNIPALLAFQKVVKEKGESYISDFVHNLGIDYGDTLFESASIGGFDGVSPLQMSAAYASFGRGGVYIEPYIFTKVEYIDTGDVYEHKYEKKQVMSEETAYMITDMLMTAAKTYHVGGISISGTDIAAKTGTPTIDSDALKKYKLPSGATRDAWNITYSPEYSIALWVGYEKLTDNKHYLTVSTGGTIRNAIMKAIAPKIYAKNKKFTRPSGVVSVTVENETYPAQLPSAYTPASLKVTDIFKEGAEPTETSSRFAKLANPTNAKSNFDGTTLTLSWDPIKTPDAINPTALRDLFNANYGNYAEEYYNARIKYNNDYIGTLGYQVYRKEEDGTLTYLGRSENNSLVISKDKLTNGQYTYVIKAAYSKFTSNMSDGLNIVVQTNFDTNVGDLVGGNETPSETPTPSTDTPTEEIPIN